MRNLAGMNMDQIMDGMKDFMPGGGAPGQMPPGMPGMPGAPKPRPQMRSADREKAKRKRKQSRADRKKSRQHR
jgi:hypothetical protein